MDKKTKKTTSIKESDKNKFKPIVLITLVSCLSYFFYPSDFSVSDKIILIIPVFTALLSIYGSFYGFKQKKTKILFTILVIISILILSLTWWVYEFTKGMKPH